MKNTGYHSHKTKRLVCSHVSGQNGSSLVSVMVAVAISAIIAITVISLTNMMVKSERTFRVRSESDLFRNDVATFLGLGKTCRGNLQGTTLPTDGITPLNINALFGLNAAGTAVDPQKKIVNVATPKDATIIPGLKVNSVAVTNISSAGGPNLYAGSLVLTYKADNIDGPSIFDRKVTMTFVTDSANVIQDCGVSGGTSVDSSFLAPSGPSTPTSPTPTPTTTPTSTASGNCPSVPGASYTYSGGNSCTDSCTQVSFPKSSDGTCTPIPEGFPTQIWHPPNWSSSANYPGSWACTNAKWTCIQTPYSVGD